MQLHAEPNHKFGVKPAILFFSWACLQHGIPRAPIMWHVQLYCHTHNRKVGSGRAIFVFVSLVRNKVSSRRRFNIVKAPLVAVWAQDQGRATVPTASVVDRGWERRHGRVSPEEQGRNLGRSVTAIYRLFSVARQVVLSTSNFLGPMSRWVVVWRSEVHRGYTT